MDQQLFELINERSDRQDEKLDRIEELLRAHVEKDEVYWRKIDTQDGQIKALKGVGSAIVFLAGVAEWLFRR